MALVVLAMLLQLQLARPSEVVADLADAAAAPSAPAASSPSSCPASASWPACGGIVCPLPATCPSTDFALSGVTYHSALSIDSALCIMSSYSTGARPAFTPMHVEAAREAHRFALVLATWVRSLLPTPHPPLAFAYYVDSNAVTATAPCATAKSGPYVAGGGKPLCRMLREITTLGDGSMHEYLVQLLDLGKTLDSNLAPFFNKYQWAKDQMDQVRRQGFEIYARFIHAFDTRFAYNPNVDPYGEQLLGLVSGYYGMTGGGGSGAGFEISCKNLATGTATLLVDGGGGFGAGVNSPQKGSASAVDAGGGGGAGVNVHVSAALTVVLGAGASNHPYGEVEITNAAGYATFAQKMKLAVAAIQACDGGATTVVELTGGGDGGVGFAAYQPDGQSEYAPGVDMGFGFQFAVGKNASLVNNAQNQIGFLVCPFQTASGAVNWQRCIGSAFHGPTPSPTSLAPTRPTRPTPKTKSPTRVPTPAPVPTHAPVPTLSPVPTRPSKSPTSSKPSKAPTHAPTHAGVPRPVPSVCGAQIAKSVCSVATYPPGNTPYNFWDYPNCACPIAREYALEFGGRVPQCPKTPEDGTPNVLAVWNATVNCRAAVVLGCGTLKICGGGA